MRTLKTWSLAAAALLLLFGTSAVAQTLQWIATPLDDRSDPIRINFPSLQTRAHVAVLDAAGGLFIAGGSNRPGSPIGGLSIKGGRNPGGGQATRLVTAQGQEYDWSYDGRGNCIDSQGYRISPHTTTP